MSEIRKDILSGNWVILADNRMGKPYDFEFPKVQKERIKVCAFCPGNEDMTTDTISEVQGEKGWEIRVFSNKYPAVEGVIDADFSGEINISGHAAGRHEIVVDTPMHGEKIQDFSEDKLKKLFLVLQERFRDMEKEEIIQYIHIFKNCGPSAGASVSHSHWQVLGVPFVPKGNEDVYENARKFAEEKGRSIFESIIDAEKSEGSRIVAENEKFIAYVPYASGLAFELHITDKVGGEAFGAFSCEKLECLAEIFKECLFMVGKIQEDICFNISFSDAPRGSAKDFYNWYARIIPRFGSLAGFEMGTGAFINPVYPEKAAEFYRSVKKKK